MKKVMVCIALYTIFLLSACSHQTDRIMDISSNSSNLEFQTGILTEDDFSLMSYNTGKQIRPGSSSKEIETFIGKPQEELKGLIQFDNIILCVRDREYKGGFIIQAHNNETNEYKTFRGICLGTDKAEIEKVYGIPSAQLDYNILNYVFRKDNMKYILLNDKELKNNNYSENNLYFFQFQLNKKNQVTMITTGDYRFVYTMQ